jgi:hypothetical protein
LFQVSQKVRCFIPCEQAPILEKTCDTLVREPSHARIAVAQMRLPDSSNVWVEAVCSMLRVEDRIGG